MSVLDTNASQHREGAAYQIRPRPTNLRIVPWDWGHRNGNRERLWASYALRIIHPRRTGWLGTVFNGSGMNTVSIHRCTACRAVFRATPADATFNECLGDACPSYSPHGDASFLFERNEES